MSIHSEKPEFGYPRITMALQDEGYQINHKKVYHLMKELDIQSHIRKNRRYHGHTPSVRYPNRLKRQFKACGPNQKVVTDITYVSDGSRFIICQLSKTSLIMKSLAGNYRNATIYSLYWTP
ncbi:IS3 family transposase [Halalkalibacterium halodurans]|uniref:IS3 family transposase n=1 Tax=Halalkalibacterium halodurans TaxID=86665 RepID=UPI002E2302A8|nr:IS3 family transposase [Halalkalibacterium halodurans]